jgi:tripartite-type tricarboxylate transporter receptor subunit TctC
MPVILTVVLSIPRQRPIPSLPCERLDKTTASGDEIAQFRTFVRIPIIIKSLSDEETVMNKREFLKAASAFTTVTLAVGPGLAQSAWPEKGKPIKVIVPWPPGAANDALGRLVAQRLADVFGATTVTENRVGGAGTIGTNAVIQSPPDGYTLLASAFNTAVMPKVLKAATFDPLADLEAVARTAVAPLCLVITGARPEKTLGELIASAKKDPKPFNFAISSLGSAGHLATVEFLRKTGLDIQMVPYKGTAPALQDMMGGNVQLLIDPSFALLKAADGTKVRALAIATKERSALAPDLPTFHEQGVKDFYFNSWYMIWAPKGTPRDIQEKINKVVQDTMKDPEQVKMWRSRLLEPVAESIEDTRAFMKSEVERSNALLASINYQPE